MFATVGDHDLISGDLETRVALGFGHNGLTELRKASCGRVPVIFGVSAGRHCKFHNGVRGREIRLSGTKTNDILACCFERFGPSIDGEGGRWLEF